MLHPRSPDRWSPAAHRAVHCAGPCAITSARSTDVSSKSGLRLQSIRERNLTPPHYRYFDLPESERFLAFPAKGLYFICFQPSSSVWGHQQISKHLRWVQHNSRALENLRVISKDENLRAIPSSTEIDLVRKAARSEPHDWIVNAMMARERHSQLQSTMG